jgi:cytochrome c5
LVLGLVLAACGGGEEPAADLDGKALVEERCTVCHNLQTITGAKKSRDGWQSNVERMIDKGAQLNDAEKAAVIDYLAEAYPE